MDYTNNDNNAVNSLNELFFDIELGDTRNREITETYTFVDSFTDEEIEWILNYCPNIPETHGEVGEIDGEVADVRTSSIRWIPINKDTLFIYERILSMVKEANDEIWDFNIHSLSEEIQFTEYYGSENGHYSWHLDIGPKINYRKISITIQLSDEDEYEGGELELLKGHDSVVIPKEKGMATLFPSYVLHRVRPVTKGIRRSLVLWVSGPSFR